MVHRSDKFYKSKSLFIILCSEEFPCLIEISSIVKLSNIKANWHDWRGATVLKFSKSLL